VNEKSEIRMKGFIDKISKDELTSVFIAIVSISPNDQDLQREIFSSMGGYAQSLLLVAMLEMVLTGAENKRRREMEENA